MSGPVGLNPSRDVAMRQARQAYQAWQASPQGASPAQNPQALRAFVQETAQRLRMSPQEVMQALAPYAGQAGGPMSARETTRAATGAAAYLRQAGMAVPPPPPPAPPPSPALPPEEKGFFDRLIEGASNLGDAILDGAETILTAPTDALAAVTRDVPILGSLTGALAESVDQTVGFASGFVRGAGALVEGVANMVAHPIDTVSGLWNMASHIPMVPANPFRLANAAWDIAVEGKPMAETLRNNLDPRITLADDYAFGKNLVSAFTEPYREAWSQGRYGEAIGRGAFEVVTMLASGGGTAAARGTVEVANVASKAGEVARVARAAEVANVARAGEAANLARAAEVANVASDLGRAGEAANVARTAEAANAARAAEAANLASDAGRAAEAANAARAAEAANASRAAEAANAGRAAEAGSAGRVAEGANAGRAAEGANAGRAAEGANAGRAAETSTAGRAAEGSDVARAAEAAPARPPRFNAELEQAQARFKAAAGDRPITPDGPASAAQQADLAQELRFSDLDEAGKQRLMEAIEADARQLGRSVPEDTFRAAGNRPVSSLDDFRHAEELLETLKRENPAALNEIYDASYRSVGIDPAAMRKFTEDTAHMSKKYNGAFQAEVQAQTDLVMRGAQAEELTETGRLIKQIVDTRADRQAFMSEVLGTPMPDAYRVYRGTSNPASVNRVIEAWATGEKGTVTVTNRGFGSSSLDPRVAPDFARGGPRSATVDAQVAEYRRAIAKNPELAETLPVPVRNATNGPSVSFDLDIPNDRVIIDKYTDGGYQIDGSAAQRAQREVAVGGNTDMIADSRRAQINYGDRTYMFEDRQALFDAIRRDQGLAPDALPQLPTN